MDKELLNFLLNNEPQRIYKDDKYLEILNKLSEIDAKLQLLLKSKPNKSICEQILGKTYVIVSASEIDPKLHPSLFILDLDGEKVLVTFKDTIELLKMYFMIYKDQVEIKIPRRLTPLFGFLKKNGLIYLDHEDMTYKFV
ncbi:hypothetical protein [Sulfurisphaera tokodaii]|uniref:Uncharacterized protein n=2 Tax=Sulfurisphaera tokodaii TaxID=111955 RepID=Q974Y4_SULTO|nr:hypothetical protein [Sulfurisphaera tokodaii]BAB65523.1 hypothetical protein STK_05280 [Sulfurisphaera tokodaii str. 7]HII74777.1 hypothetical protein [Sulfurisphaera tokodaii]